MSCDSLHQKAETLFLLDALLVHQAAGLRVPLAAVLKVMTSMGLHLTVISAGRTTSTCRQTPFYSDSHTFGDCIWPVNAGRQNTHAHLYNEP